MSNVFQDRRIRHQAIKKGLQFLQSPLPYPGTQEHYAIFIQDLVRNLFNEGNYLYRDGDWNAALNQYTEALNITDYASSEEICISRDIVEKLHVNRAACYTDMGCHDKVLEDCIAALSLNDNNFRALYRKAQAFCELGRHKEAYDVAVKCSLAVPQDGSVIKLTQELAKKLGLKVRKAYVRAKPPVNADLSEGLSTHSGCSAEDIELDIPGMNHNSHSSISSQSPLSLTPEGLSESISSLSPSLSSASYVSVEQGSFPSAVIMNGGHTPFSVPESCLAYGDGDILGEEFDNLLDSAPGTTNSDLSPTKAKGPIPTGSKSTGLCFPSIPFGTFPTQSGFGSSISVSELYPRYLTPLDNVCSLKSLSTSESQTDIANLISRNGGSSLNSNNSSYLHMNGESGLYDSDSFNGIPNQCSNDSSNSFGGEVVNAPTLVPLVSLNPLDVTHEFREACQLCFVKSGSKILDFVYNPSLEHKCKKDILLGRIKNSDDKLWKKIRPRPTKTQYVGPFYICKDVAAEEECKYPGHCTFAYCQEEIDIWTLERRGAFSRETLFGSGGKDKLTVLRILQEHNGIFIFLCERCFDHKPRIISKENKDDPVYCSHPISRHDFEANKCLVHILRETTVKYSKIRSFSSQCQLDLCRHEVRYGCLREDECFYAHSLVELKIWMMQKETGIFLDAVAQDSRNLFPSVEMNTPTPQVLGCQMKVGSQKLKIKFVCSQCWRNGQVIEPDKQKKYCSAKARHPWAKERRAVLVMSVERKKWMAVRPVPTKKPVPLQFDLCNHIATGKKCQYVGNCSFAHSPEEKEMWTYMRENVIQDMEQLYELWLKSQTTTKGEDSSALTNKQIHMPTDYAEITVDFHCWLCGKNCNSERQWKQHLFSEKHKERVFHSEEDQNFWQHRFPTGYFSICERYMAGACFEGDNCLYAHGSAELMEWEERKHVLKLKLNKARKDHLVAPFDNDFGKYSFLINDLN